MSDHYDEQAEDVVRAAINEEGSPMAMPIARALDRHIAAALRRVAESARAETQLANARTMAAATAAIDERVARARVEALEEAARIFDDRVVNWNARKAYLEDGGDHSEALAASREARRYGEAAAAIRALNGGE